MHLGWGKMVILRMVWLGDIQIELLCILRYSAYYQLSITIDADVPFAVYCSWQFIA